MPSAVSRPLDDVALLIGLPVTEEEFKQRLPHSDYLARFRPDDEGPDANPDSEAWHSHAGRSWAKSYQPVTAASLRELSAFASALGVQVICGATLVSLRKASTNSHKVIVLSHWKGAEVGLDDILCSELAAWLMHLRGHNSPVTRRLQQMLSALSVAGELGQPGRAFRPAGSRLRDVLNETIEASEDLEQDPEEPIRWHPLVLRTKRRDEIDTIFAGLLQPGNRLELFDGMHDMNDIEECIAPDFTGVLDLTTCTSAAVGEYVSAKRNYRLRLVSFPTPIAPEFSTECVKLALALTADGQPYLTARDQAIEWTRQIIEQEDRRRRGWFRGWLGRLRCNRSKKC